MTDEEKTATVELTPVEMGMLLRIMVEKRDRGTVDKRDRGAEEGDLFAYEVPLAVVGNKLLAAMAKLDDPDAEVGTDFTELREFPLDDED
jgi:hypothetical protein